MSNTQLPTFPELKNQFMASFASFSFQNTYGYASLKELTKSTYNLNFLFTEKIAR